MKQGSEAAWPPFIVVTVLLCLPCSASCARTDEEEPGEITPPIVGQPANFSGAVGRFSISMQAEPTVLQAEERIALKVRIGVAGAGSRQSIKRPDIRKNAQFNKLFDITENGERDLPAEKAREFSYWLRPRSDTVKQIPALPFVFYNPAIIPASKGYQTAYAKAIALAVKPRAPVTVAPLDPPDSVLQVPSAAEILHHGDLFALPGWAMMLAMLLAPPALCLAYLVTWRRAHPDNARVAKQRRSRAARLASKRLESLPNLCSDEQAPRAKEILVSYLRERFEFVVSEPTPAEVSSHLQQRGLSSRTADAVGQFVAACDAVRFAPGLPREMNDWTGPGTGLIEALEAEA